MDKNGRLPGDSRTEALKPAIVSIPDACRYLGDVSRAKLYADLLPQLDTVHIGSRHFVVVASLDRLIERLKDNRDTNAGRSRKVPPKRQSMSGARRAISLAPDK